MEIDIAELNLQIRRLVAAGTACRAMGPEKRKFRGGVIEIRKVAPLRSRMTGLTARLLPGRGEMQHSLAKLPTMRIKMARSTGAILKSVWSDLFELS
jgi:hypothetical protein